MDKKYKKESESLLGAVIFEEIKRRAEHDWKFLKMTCNILIARSLNVTIDVA